MVMSIFSVTGPLTHCPASGVNVYVVMPAVAVLIAVGFQLPVMPLVEVVDSNGAVLFWHKGTIGANEGVMAVVTVSNPEALVLTQPDVVLVITTLYVPAVVVVKLGTLPGLVTPAGTVHA